MWTADSQSLSDFEFLHFCRHFQILFDSRGHSLLYWNQKGELMYENKAISGSHMVDLINDFLRQRKGLELVGWSVFSRGLARMNVHENLV